MTETTTDFCTEEIAENWIADRSLPPEQITWLKTEHQKNLERPGEASTAHIAPGHICTELDLPQGSAWLEVMASLLDAVEGTGEQRLHEVQIAWGLGDDDDVEDLGHD